MVRVQTSKSELSGSPGFLRVFWTVIREDKFPPFWMLKKGLYKFVVEIHKEFMYERCGYM